MKAISRCRSRFVGLLLVVVLPMLVLVEPALAANQGLSHLFGQSGNMDSISQGGNPEPTAAAPAPAIAGQYQANRAALPGDGATLPQPGTINSTMRSQFGIQMTNADAAWTAEQAQAAWRVLTSLPPAFRNCTTSIKRVRGSSGILGYVYLGNPTVHLCNSAVRPGTFQGTLVHEMTHCFQAKNPQILSEFRRLFWPGNRRLGRSVSNYGCTSSIEDMAECARAYWAKGALMKRYYPARYEFMRRYVFGGVEYLDPAAPTGGAIANPPTQQPPATPPAQPPVVVQPPTPPAPPAAGTGANTSIKVDARSGGGNMERQAYSWAAGAVQPRTNDPTVLRHEAVHYLNGELSRNVSWSNLSPNVSRAFYLWGTNTYYVVPNTGVRKIEVKALVPTHLTTHHQNYFHNFDFGSRDALHILEDFSAEISSGEKSALLFDMLVFSAALGLKMEQLNASGQNNYWSRDAGSVYRGTIKTFMEKAATGISGRLQALARDTSSQGTALRSFLKRTYGDSWTRQVLGF